MRVKVEGDREGAALADICAFRFARLPEPAAALSPDIGRYFRRPALPTV